MVQDKDSIEEETQQQINDKQSEGQIPIKDGAIFHAFSWDFNTIRQSLPMIATGGFRSIQTSPINKVLDGEDGEWIFMEMENGITIISRSIGRSEIIS